MFTQTWKSPLGTIYLAGDDSGLAALAFSANWNEVRTRLPKLAKGEHPVMAKAISELEEYFAGKRRDFSVPLAPKGSKFQLSAWQALGKIPFGSTATYGEQASRMRNPKAVRAVGRANGANPISILVPCHRVVGASGALTGYSGGLTAKKKLLELEKAQR